MLFHLPWHNGPPKAQPWHVAAPGSDGGHHFCVSDFTGNARLTLSHLQRRYRTALLCRSEYAVWLIGAFEMKCSSGPPMQPQRRPWQLHHCATDPIGRDSTGLYASEECLRRPATGGAHGSAVSSRIAGVLATAHPFARNVLHTIHIPEFVWERRYMGQLVSQSSAT